MWLYADTIVWVWMNTNTLTRIHAHPIICAMIIIVTSINLILTHQIFVRMTLKITSTEFPLIIFIFIRKWKTKVLLHVPPFFNVVVCRHDNCLLDNIKILKMHVFLFSFVFVVVTTLYHKDFDNSCLLWQTS